MFFSVDNGPKATYPCINEYRKGCLVETPVYRHAALSHNSHIYFRSSYVTFKCEADEYLIDYKGQPFVDGTECEADGSWSKSWPVCKGIFI